MEKTTISIHELADALGISMPTAYKLTQQKDFPAFRIGTRIIIPAEQFKEWLNNQIKNKK